MIHGNVVLFGVSHFGQQLNFALYFGNVVVWRVEVDDFERDDLACRVVDPFVYAPISPFANELLPVHANVSVVPPALDRLKRLAS